jgi:photosystem II stability/assembly factor-like uncharacterized protein
MSVLLLVASAPCLCQRAYAGEASAGKGKWTVISDNLVSSTPVPRDFNGLPGKTLKTTGVAVDRIRGAVIVVLFRSQIFRSSDKGKTFERIDGGKVCGICQTGWAINVDPNNGDRMACFLIYGTSGLTLDGGKTWTQFDGGDFGAVDWSAAEPKVMLRTDHGRGQVYLTKDTGKTWKLIGKANVGNREMGESGGLGVVDAGTLLLHRKDGTGIERSIDAGETWTKVSDLNPKSGTALVFEGVVYWVGAEGLIVSRDKGRTWHVQGAPVDAIMGPFLGKDEKHIVVVGLKGFFETTDGGRTWKNVMPLTAVEAALDPKVYYHGDARFGMKCVLTFNDSFAWDPVGNVFYHSRMTDSAIKYER